MTQLFNCYIQNFFACFRKNLLRSYSIDRNCILSDNDEMKKRNPDDDKGKRKSKNSEDISQQCDGQIANTPIKTASISTTNVNKVCQSKIRKRNLSKTLADTSQNKSTNKDSTASSSANCENNYSISPEKYQKKERKLKEILSTVKTELTNTLQECRIGKNESNICSSRNINSELNSKARFDNIADECQDESILMKETDVNLELINHNPPLYQTYATKNDVKMNSKKITRKRTSSERSLDKYVSTTQKQKKIKSIHEETSNNNSKTFNNETHSDNKLSSTKQINRKSIEQEVRETDSIRLRKKKNKIKLNNLIKNKRAKLHKYFRGTNGPNTSESEEEREILFNHLKRKAQESDYLYKATRNNITNILKLKKVSKHDTSTGNLSKDTKSSASLKLKSGKSRDSGSAKKCSNNNSVTDEETEDEASKYDKSIDNLHISNCRNSDDSCDSTACTEKCFSMFDKVTDDNTESAASIYEQDTSAIGETTNIEISNKINSANLNDSSDHIEKCYVVNDAMTESDEKSIPSTRDTSPNNSPTTIENASSNVKSEYSCDSTASTAKCNSHDATDKDVKDRTLSSKNVHINKSQNNDQEKTTNVAPRETKADSCDSTTSTEESIAVQDVRNEIAHMKKCNTMHNVAMENTKDKESIYIPDALPNNLQTNIENTISREIKSNCSCDSTVSLENKKDEDKESLGKFNNSQESANSVTLISVNVDDSNDSTCMKEKYIVRNDKIENRTSSYKCDTESNNSQENIKDHKVAEKEQHTENSSLIASTKNNTSNAKSNNDIPFATEIDFEKDKSENINLNSNAESKIDGIYAEPNELNTQVSLENRQENQEVRNSNSSDLARCEDAQNHVTSVLKLPIVHTHDSTLSNINEKNDCELQNDENLLLTCNNNIIKDGRPIEQLSVITSTSETISSEKNYVLSVQATDLSTSLNTSNDSGDDHLSDDEDDIEIQIQIKPKQKNKQTSRKISLKAPWSAVNTCIKNLNTLKKDPGLFNKFFKISDDISEKSPSKTSLENNTSVNNNQILTTETENCDITCDSSPISKDNEDDSQQQQNFPNYSTLSENKNTIDSDKKETNKCMQSIIITENNLESNKLIYDMPDLEPLEATEINDKQEINKEQESLNNTTLEEAKSIAGCKEKENQRVSSTEQEDIQMKKIGNSAELVKTACNTSNVKEQLQTSDNATTDSSKLRSQSHLEINYRYTTNIKSTNFSTPAVSENAFSMFHQSASPQSTFESLPQSTLPQSMHPQVSFQLMSQQSRPQLSAPVVSFQIVSSPVVPFQIVSSPVVPVQVVPSPMVPVQTVPVQIIPSQVKPQVKSQVKPQVKLPNVNTLDLDKPPPLHNANVNADRHNNISLKTSVEINNQNNDYEILIHKSLKDIFINIAFFRKLIQENPLYYSIYFVPNMDKARKEITNSLNNLMIWLNMNIVDVISYINRFKIPESIAITQRELEIYYQITEQHLHYYFSPNMEKCNLASQYRKIIENDPNKSLPNVNTQSAPKPAPKKTKTAKASNINQQQLFNSSVNSSHLYPKQPMPNVQRYTSFIPSQNTNLQQVAGNVNNSIQGQYIPSTNVSNVNAQHKLTNNNVPSLTNMSRISYQNNRNSTNTTMQNVRQDVNVIQRQANSNQQVFLEKPVCSCVTYLNKTKHTFVPQSQCNVQTQYDQNIPPNQNLQIPQQRLTKQHSEFYKNVPTSSNTNNLLQRTEDIKSQVEDRTQQKASYTNMQDSYNKISNPCNESQNTYNNAKSLPLPESSMLQNTTSLQEANKVSKSISKTNSAPTLDISFLTDLQKVMLHDQVRYLLSFGVRIYSSEWNESIQQLYSDRSKLIGLFYYLNSYLKKIRENDTEQNNNTVKSNTSEKCTENDSQNDISQNKSVSQKNAMQMSVDETVKIQSNRDNKNTLSDKNLQTQSRKKSVDSNISENSKFATIKSYLKTQNKKLSLTQKFPDLTRKLAENTEQQMQNDDNLKKTSQESILVDTKKPESNETLLLEHSKTLKESLEMLLMQNSKVKNNVKIDKSLRATSLYGEKVSEVHSCPQSPLNLSHDVLMKETEYQFEITKDAVNEKSNNVKTKSTHDTSNVTILNSNKENMTQFSRNIINQNKEIHNTSSEVSSENLQNKMSNNANNSDEVLSQLNVLLDLVSSLNNTEQSILQKEECTSSKISQVHIENEKCTEILFNSSKSPQQISTNEENTNANEEISDEMSDCSEKLYIDENVEEEQKDDQCDEASFSKDDDFYTLHRVDSPWPLDKIKYNPSEVMPIFLLKNPIDNISQDIVDKTQNAATFNEELSEEKPRESTFKFEDEWNTEENMKQVESTKENNEKIKTEEEEESEEEVSFKLQLSEDELNTEESSMYIQRSIVIKEETIIDTHDSIQSEDELNAEENATQLSNLELPKNIEEQNAIDTHSNIRTIHEQLKHVSEQKPGKSQTYSLNFGEKDNAAEEIMLYQQSNDICDNNMECISVKSEDSEITPIPSIINIKSILPSSFEEIGMSKGFENDIELNEKNEKLLDINESLGNLDDVDDSLCLRCKRKSTVLCTCLKAHYCSKRCSYLHWITKHYKECKGDLITCIDL
ncbi:hypothetical protein PUN28_006522 [Cardiocondyla obscurior]|uniref:MYND-type domain-containing protein n=1 Tax=Cardiocondyla obscurior TaxID=286306 RepID=A0AAW2GAS2_9HYME